MKKSCYLAINDHCSPSYRNQSIESIDWLLYDEVHWSLMGEALRFFAIPNGLTHYYTVLKDLDFLTVIPLQWKQNTCQISNTYRILEYIYKIAELKKKKKKIWVKMRACRSQYRGWFPSKLPNFIWTVVWKVPAKN